MRVGHELIGAGGPGKPLDYSELERWTRVGFERGWRHDAASDDSVKSKLIVLHFAISEARP
jgi:hypothetical protein